VTLIALALIGSATEVMQELWWDQDFACLDDGPIHILIPVIEFCGWLICHDSDGKDP
jgi:hypothetical protein